MGGRRFLRTSAAVCPGSGKGCSLRVPVGEPLFPLPLKALLSLSFQNSPARGVPRPRKWPFARNLASVSCEMAGKNFVQLFRTPHKKIRWEGLAELSRPQTTEGKEAPSFPATRASEMTPLMTDRATFLQESSPVRHASLCRKRPLAFFDKLSRTGAGVRHGFFQVPKRCPKRRRSGTYENVGEICRRKLTKCSNSGMFKWAAAEDAEAQADQESSRNPY